jgi:hypothetical protein
MELDMLAALMLLTSPSVVVFIALKWAVAS